MCMTGAENAWRLIINFSRTSVVHFRNRGKHRSEFEFKIGNQKVEYASVYRYRGVHMNEHLDFVNTADTLSKAGVELWVQLFQRYIVTRIMVLKLTANYIVHALYLS